MSEEEKKKEDKKIEETGVDKEVSQKESVKGAEEELNKSLYFYHQIVEKLRADNICYKCKQPIKDKEEKDKESMSHILTVRTCDPGLAVFASICQKCFQELSQQENK